MSIRLAGYPLDVRGQSNLPGTGPGVINAVHQDGDDVFLVLASAMVETGRPVSPLVDVDSGQSFAENQVLEILDVTWALRGSEPLAKRRQKESYQEMLKKALAGKLQAAWSEGTFCPRFDDVLGLFVGSSVRLSQEYYALTGQKMLNYPSVMAYEFDEKGRIRVAHLEFLEPFDAIDGPGFVDQRVAAEALREVLLRGKRELYARCMPNMTPADYARFRAAGHRRHPRDPDYYDCGRFSLNYELAAKAGDDALAAQILAMFKP